MDPAPLPDTSDMTIATPAERSRDVDRLLTFVDAIVAIAVTLLVLPLVDVAGDVEPGMSVWRVVHEHSGEFVAFLLSFVVIARLWVAQHRVVRAARTADRPLVASLIAWTLTIVVLPFPTALLSRAADQPATKVFYIGSLALSAALLGVVGVTVRRQLPAASGDRPSVAATWIDAVLFTGALLVSLLAPDLGYYPLLVLLLAGSTERVLRRRTPRGVPVSEAAR